MPVVIRTRPEDRKQKQRVELDGDIFDLVLTWRARVSGWYLDMYRKDGTPIALGRRIEPGWSPFLGSTSPDLPNGGLVVIGPDDYERTDLGSQLRLVYYSAEEIGFIPDDDTEIAAGVKL